MRSWIEDTSLRGLGRLWRAGLAVPVTFIALMVWFGPLASLQDFDYDEGINLIKALLVSNGHPLYTEVWSDQPPLMTVWLSWWFHAFGTSVVGSRLLIVLFSALLLWTFFVAARTSVSMPAGLGAVVLLVLSEEYIRLSASVMIGLPSLAVAMAAVSLLLLARGRHRVWMAAASGVVLALAVHTKLWAAMLAPAMLGQFFMLERTLRPIKSESPRAVRSCLSGQGVFFAGHARGVRLPVRSRLVQAVIWGIAAAGTYLLVGLVFNALRPQELIMPHVSAQTRGAFLDTGNLAFLRDYARRYALYELLAAVGIVWAIRQRNSGLFLPLAWLVTATLALAYQKPLWHHHVTLLNIPLAWLAAFGIEAWVHALRQTDWRQFSILDRYLPSHSGYVRSGRSAPGGETGPINPGLLKRYLERAHSRPLGLVILAGLVTAALLLYPAPLDERVHEQTFRNRPYYNAAVVERLCADAAAQPGWVFTDRPYYAFQAGMLVPPPIAVLSRKCLQSGIITEDMLLEVLTAYRPRYVVLERFLPNYGERLMAEITRSYELVLDVGGSRYYVRRA